MSKYTTELFIQKAIQVHGNKYDYSKVEYINAKTKIIIICKEHGEFLQRADAHLNGNTCKKCSINKQKLTTEDFIKKAKIKHGNKYDYSKVNYIGIYKKVIIICKIHGEFEQIAHDHHKAGCSKCNGGLKSNTKEFIKKAIIIHGDKYDYSKVDYIKNNINIIIICKDHGSFLQTPASHLINHGCQKCKGGLKSNTKEFIEKAIKIYNDIYDYSKVEYINNSSKIIIICKEHGDFFQTPYNHINNKQGCIKCSKSNFSKPQIQWLKLLSKLNNIYIQHALNNGEFKIPTTNFKADGYCKETNTIYEFHGDYWHGNPKTFDPDSLNKICNMTYRELYEKTLKKERNIKDLGYNLVVIWESEWNKINKSIKILQKRFKLKII